MYDKNEILRLLRAQKSVSDIMALVKCSRATVFRVKASIGLPTVPRKPGSGRKRSVRTPALIQSIKMKVTRNPVRSMRKMAKQANVSEATVRRVVKYDLKGKSRARVKRHLITDRIKAARVERSKKLLSELKKRSVVILFTDEKLFTVDSVSNSRTNRYISSKKASDVPENIKFTFRTKHPAGVMVFGLVASDGKTMDPVFIQEGLKVNTHVYLGILKNHVLPWITSTYGKDANIVFQQDGAPAHTSKKTQMWLKDNMPQFWSKEMWPPSSPDLNPLDFSVWANIEARVCEHPHSNLNSLRTSITKHWREISSDYIVKVCKSFRRRLEAVINANGGHIE